MIRFLRTWLTALLCSAAAFLAGFIAFAPGWKEAPPLTDGSAASFQRAAEKIDEEHLLENASPQERVRWLLEICRQPDGLARDHALYEAIQHMQPGDFLSAIADLPALERELTAMGEEVRAGLIEASMERWLEVDKDAALRWLVVARGIVESDAIPLPQIGAQDLGAAHAVLAAREPEWLRAQLDKLGKKTQRKTAIRTLMSAEAQRDPRKAREWLETFRGSKEWGETFAAYVTRLSVSDPRAAMEMALSEDGKQVRTIWGELASELFITTVARSPSLAAEFLPKIEPKKRQQLMWMAVYFVGENGGDPFAWFVARRAQFAELTAGRSRSMLIAPSARKVKKQLHGCSSSSSGSRKRHRSLDRRALTTC